MRVLSMKKAQGLQESWATEQAGYVHNRKGGVHSVFHIPKQHEKIITEELELNFVVSPNTSR